MRLAMKDLIDQMACTTQEEKIQKSLLRSSRCLCILRESKRNTTLAPLIFQLQVLFFFSLPLQEAYSSI